MAKTKLLADIASQTDMVSNKMNNFANTLLHAPRLDPAHWTELSEIRSAIETLSQTIGKLEARIKSWDGSTKLRDIFKNKKVLANARQVAKDQAQIIRTQEAAAKEMFEMVVAEMQRVAKAATH